MMQGISSHGIDLIFLIYSSLNTRRVNSPPPPPPPCFHIWLVDNILTIGHQILLLFCMWKSKSANNVLFNCHTVFNYLQNMLQLFNWKGSWQFWWQAIICVIANICTQFGEIKNNAWVTVNDDFWVTCEAICQKFSLANRITSDLKIVIHGNECIILFLTCYLMSLNTQFPKTIIDRWFRHWR